MKDKSQGAKRTEDSVRRVEAAMNIKQGVLSVVK